jgi:hypothetical protein
MNQLEIQFFFPLTEQMELDLDYGWPTHLHYKARGLAGTSSMPILGSTFEFTKPTWTTSINIDTNNIVITSKHKQPLYRRVLFKLLGINWKQT